MIDSLLFLPDVVDVSAADVHLVATPVTDEPPATSARDDAEALAAVAATRDGHAHALRGAWEAASAALERSAGMRERLVEAGLAGPIVAARGWSDVAAVRFAADDVEGARAALARVRAATDALVGLPAELAAAIAELAAELGDVSHTVAPVHTPVHTPAPENQPAAEPAGGLLWLDTTDDVPADVPAPDAEPGRATAVTEAAAPAAPNRIAAVDDAVALADAGRATHGGPGGLGARLRRLLRR